MDKIKINLYELLKCISDAQDLVSPLLSNHHQQVAYLSYRLANEMGLHINEQKDIFLAGLVHDIGALSKDERLEIIEKESIYVNNHAFVGAKLLKEFKPLQNSAKIIQYHHIPWNYGNGNLYKVDYVPYGSHVIHLADHVCRLIRKDFNILSQIPTIMETIISKNNLLFEPKLVQALTILSKEEYIWLDLTSTFPVNKVNMNLFDFLDLEIDDIIDLSFIFSQIIDFRSSFTAKHSAGVAKIAEVLAKLVGFSDIECKMMLVAGYLHDLGKLAIGNEVLEKPAKLDENEFNAIRSHTYFTYQLLDTIPQFKLINEWASYHHERLDGKGYPFHIKGDNLTLGSRIMAVADVFTAITESRPYRDGMDHTHAIKVLNDMVKSGALDGNVVGILTKNYEMINALRVKSQQEAEERYEKFLII